LTIFTLTFVRFLNFSSETCRCPRVIHTNYIIKTPYLNKASNGFQLDGMFWHQLCHGIYMLIYACGNCSNGYGISVIDFDMDGNHSSARMEYISDVVGDIDNEAAFPSVATGT